MRQRGSKETTWTVTKDWGVPGATEWQKKRLFLEDDRALVFEVLLQVLSSEPWERVKGSR